MDTSRQHRFDAEAAQLGYDFSGKLLVGGNYVAAIRHGNTVYVSGQVPRVGDQVVVTGEVGTEVTLERAQHAAAVCAMRGLALVAQAAGSLDAVDQVLSVGVHVRSAPGFTQQSEVANGASDLLARVLGPAGTHTRTSTGVAQLPKGASVEVEMVVALRASPGLAPGPLVDEYLRRHMIPDPVAAAELVAPGMRIRFTGNRPMSHPAQATAFNKSRYAWLKKKIERTEVVAGGTPEETVIYSLGTLHGAWPDGTPFEGNRYVDRYVVSHGLITEMDVWNDSAEWLLVRAGLATL